MLSVIVVIVGVDLSVCLSPPVDSNYTSTRNSSNARTNCSNDGSNLDLLSSSLGGMVVESFSGAGLGKGGGDCGSRGIAVVNSTTLLFGDVSTASNELQQSQSVEDTDPFGLGTSSIAGTSSDPLNGHSSSNQRVIEDLFAATTESSTTGKLFITTYQRDVKALG